MTTPESVLWKHAASPIRSWVMRRLPPLLFKRFYNARNLEKDMILTVFPHEMPPTLFKAGMFKAPYLQLFFTLRNASPYLDVTVTTAHVFLSSSDFHGSQGGLFGTIDDFKKIPLSRGATTNWFFQLWLNEFQYKIMDQVAKKSAKLGGHVFFWLSTPIGTVRIFDSFEIDRLEVRDFAG